MKKVLLLIIVILFQVKIFAQYQSILGEEKTAWNVRDAELFGYYTDSLVTIGDTVLNGVNYKLIEQYSFYNYTNPIKRDILIYLREDIQTGKVWYRSSLQFDEKLIMDMSLQVSDTINLLGNDYTVEDVYYENSRKHIQVDKNLHGVEQKLIFIEGVGTNAGIAYLDLINIGRNPFLLCQYKNDLINFQNNDENHGEICKVVTSLNIENHQNIITNIYPNPARDFIKIDLSTYSDNLLFPLDIKIYNNLGILVLSEASQNYSKEIMFNISNIKEGVYFLRISDTKHLLNHSFKLIISK